VAKQKAIDEQLGVMITIEFKTLLNVIQIWKYWFGYLDIGFVKLYQQIWEYCSYVVNIHSHRVT